MLRAIEEHLISRKAENLTVKANREVASYILNEKRDNLLTIEQAYGISVFIVPSDEIKGSQAVIERAVDRTVVPRRIQLAPVRIDSAFMTEDEEIEEAEVEEAVEETVERPARQRSEPEDGEARADGDAAEGERQDDGQKRRRRRGRRGGRKGREEPLGGAPETADIPGLGDQPPVMPAADGESPVETSAEESAEPPPPREPRQRRDRWGRGRDRHQPREDANTPAPLVDAMAEAEQPAPEVQEARPLPTPIPPEIRIEAEKPEEVQPRKWQPPAPTVAPAVVERKSGWWSKR